MSLVTGRNAVTWTFGSAVTTVTGQDRIYINLLYISSYRDFIKNGSCLVTLSRAVLPAGNRRCQNRAQAGKIDAPLPFGKP
jgi:hypothetical protein